MISGRRADQRIPAARSIASGSGSARGRGFVVSPDPAVPPSPVIPSAILFDLANGGDKRWGETPPYRTEVFVLTHHARPSLAMAGGTTFHFVTDGIEAALAWARSAAKGKDVRLGGGVATLRAYLRAGLVDEMHLAVSPVLLGTGEHLLQGIDLPKLGFAVTEHVATAAATHYVLTRGGR